MNACLDVNKIFSMCQLFILMGEMV